MKIVTYPQYLPPEAMIVRTTVFVEEQGFVDEYDAIDPVATHFVMYDEDNNPVATCRVFTLDGQGEEGFFFLGRLAVIKEHRGRGLGAEIVTAAEAYVRAAGGEGILLHSQSAASGFYRAVGYTAFGEPDEEQGCPHVWMKKRL